MNDLILDEHGRVDVIATLKLSLPEAHEATLAQQRLLDAVTLAEERMRHEAILRELEAALHVISVALPLAAGLGILPTAVSSIVEKVVEDIDALIEAVRGK